MLAKFMKPKGKMYPHRYKFGKQTEPIEFEMFKKVMEKGTFKKGLSHRSYLAFLYWFGVRRSEGLERTREDFKTKDGLLIVNAPAKKGGDREPLEVPVNYPFVGLIIAQVNKTRRTLTNPTRRVWNFSAATAWRIVKRVMPKHYPHFFRLNRATKFLEDPETTIPEMKAWFGWKTASSVDPYIGHSKRYIHKQRERLARELE